MKGIQTNPVFRVWKNNLSPKALKKQVPAFGLILAFYGLCLPHYGRFHQNQAAPSEKATPLTIKNRDSLYLFLVSTDICPTENPSKDCYRFEPNQVFKVTFKGLAKTQGYQFTLDHAGLELIDIFPGPYMGLDNFGVFSDKSAVTTSWNGDVLPEFSIKFKAKQAGKLDDLLRVSSRITKAVAYGYTDAQILEVALRYGIK